MQWERLIRSELDALVPYAPGLRASEVRERTGTATVRKLSSNECPFGPVPQARRAIESVIPYLDRYPDGAARALKRRLAEHLGVEERFIAVGNGSNELLRIIAQAILRPGDEAVFAWPSFVVYPMIAHLMGATPVRVPLGPGEVHDLDAMLAAISAATRIVFVCNPNNPTGTIVRRAEFERFLDRVPEHVLVVVDEAYFEYVSTKEYPNGLAYFDGDRPLVVVRTFSKIYSLAALRIGYGVMPEALVRAVDKVREPFNVNMVAQIAAFASLDAHEEVARRARLNAQQRGALYAAFERLGVRFIPSHANFVYVLTKRPRDLFEALLEEGVIVRELGPIEALRVGIGTPDDTRATIAAFERAIERLGGV